ncbi:MAG TPA: PTS sugar transporter subunit IIA [Candidatus Aminicenantes bacterium]|nr:PTS sugar transporter subunit IIA [Candidatus Aminicenantes bacterium]
MNLNDYLDAMDVFDCEEYANTDQFYAAFARFLKERNHISQPEKIKRLFIRREKVQSTAIGKGAAAPHIFSDEFSRFFICVARIRKGMDFQAPDGKPVFLVFLIMSDDRDVGLHLKSLAHIARMVDNTDIVEATRTVANAKEIYRVLIQKDELIRP